MALGSYGAVVLLRRRTAAARGSLGFTHACAIGFGVLAWASDGALPRSLGSSPVIVDAAWDGPRAAALAAFCVIAVVGLVARRMAPRWAPLVELVALATAGATLLFGALAWGGGSLGTVTLLAQLVVVSA